MGSLGSSSNTKNNKKRYFHSVDLTKKQNLTACELAYFAKEHNICKLTSYEQKKYTSYYRFVMLCVYWNRNRNTKSVFLLRVIQRYSPFLCNYLKHSHFWLKIVNPTPHFCQSSRCTVTFWQAPTGNSTHIFFKSLFFVFGFDNANVKRKTLMVHTFISMLQTAQAFPALHKLTGQHLSSANCSHSFSFSRRSDAVFLCVFIFSLRLVALVWDRAIKLIALYIAEQSAMSMHIHSILHITGNHSLFPTQYGGHR